METAVASRMTEKRVTLDPTIAEKLGSQNLENQEVKADSLLE